MKNILLLTDFSKNAKAAAATALTLSQKLHTDLLLLNTYVFYPTPENYVGGLWPIELFKEIEEDSQERLFELKRQLEELSPKTLEPGDRLPVIGTEVESTALTFGIGDVMEKNKIELIVMGAHDEEALGKNHVNDLIGYTKCPVLVVPPAADLKKAKEIVYATDYSFQDIGAIGYLAKIARAFALEMKVVHVAEPGEKAAEERDKMIFENHLKKIHNGPISYHVIRGEEVVKRLLRMITSEHAGLLAMLHRQQSLFGKLFMHSDTKELLKSKKIPVLVFPTKE